MRVLVGSDFHFEFHMDHGDSLLKLLPEADGIIIPGDLCSNGGLLMALTKVCEKYSRVWYVPGNHDFYGSDLGNGLEVLIEAEFRLPNLTILAAGTSSFRDRVTVGDTELFGATWWFQQPDDVWLRKQLADYTWIEHFAKYIDKIARDSTDATVRYLSEKTEKKKRVVITHHMPHERSVAKQFVGSRANVFFVNDFMHNYLSYFHLLHSPELALPDIWLHGHTHTACDYHLDGMRVLCNPWGYPREKPTFNKEISIEL